MVWNTTAFLNQTKTENELALTMAFTTGKRIIRYYVHQDCLCMETMTQAFGDHDRLDSELSPLEPSASICIPVRSGQKECRGLTGRESVANRAHVTGVTERNQRAALPLG